MSSDVLVNDAGDKVVDGAGNRVVWFTDDQYLGVLDDFRMLSAVPPEEVSVDNARRELDPDEAVATLCYLNFNDFNALSPTTAYDSSGNSRDGTLVGTAQWVGFPGDGTADLLGNRKPRIWGVKRMRKGVLVDSQRVVFQVNAGPTQAIVPLENGLASMTSDGDLANVYDWTPAAGHYATQLSAGLIRLNDLPDSNVITLSFDVWGDVDPDHGYTELTPEIMRNAAVHQASVDPVEGVDTASVMVASAARPDSVGYATGSSPVSVLTMLNDLAGGMDGWWTVLVQDGRWTIGLRKPPSMAEFQLGPDDTLEDGVDRQATAAVVRQWTLSYRDYEVTVPADKVAGAIPPGQRNRFSQATAYASSPDLGPEFLRRHADAIFMGGPHATGSGGNLATHYDLAAACRRECNRRLAIDQLPWDVYKIALPRGIFRYRVGQEFLLTWPRFGLGAGNLYTVGGYEEDTATGAITLFGWGLKIE